MNLNMGLAAKSQAIKDMLWIIDSVYGRSMKEKDYTWGWILLRFLVHKHQPLGSIGNDTGHSLSKSRQDKLGTIPLSIGIYPSINRLAKLFKILTPSLHYNHQVTSSRMDRQLVHALHEIPQHCPGFIPRYGSHIYYSFANLYKSLYSVPLRSSDLTELAFPPTGRVL